MKLKSNNGIWNLIKNYKFNSIYLKNFLLITILIITPLVSINCVTYYYYNNLVMDEFKSFNQGTVTRVKDMLDMVIDEVDRLSVRIAMDKSIQDFMSLDNMHMKDYNTLEMFINIDNLVNMSVTTSEYVDSMYVFSEKTKYIVTSVRGGSVIDNFYDKTWLENYNNNRDVESRTWIESKSITTPYSSKKQNYISYCRYMPAYGERKIGAVIININAEKIKKLITNTTDSQTDSIFIVGENGKILYNDDLSNINVNINEIEYLKGMDWDSGNNDFPVRNINRVNHIISLSDSKYDDLKYISVIKLEKYQERATIVKKYLALSVFVSILITIVLSFFISSRTFKPLKNIISAVNNPQKWIDWHKKNPNHISDEYGYIMNNILRTIDDKQKAEKELTLRLTQLKKAQTLALQAQINPHFIYNTLDNIRWMAFAFTKSENKVSYAITSLSELIRLCFETEENLIPLSKELELSKHYINILKIRYTDLFDVHWNVDESLLNRKVVKMILQPIIENAIFHGIKPKGGKGTIDIVIYEQNEKIVIEITDNGVGIKESEISIINDALKDVCSIGSNHIGLKNVNERIKLIFGASYGVQIENVKKEGTKVKILLPNIEM